MLSWTLDSTVLKSQDSPSCSSLTQYIAEMKMERCPPHNFMKNSTLRWSSRTSASFSCFVRSSKSSGTGGVQNIFCLISKGDVQLVVNPDGSPAEIKSSLQCPSLLKSNVTSLCDRKIVCASSKTKIRSLSFASCNASSSWSQGDSSSSFVCVASSIASMISSTQSSSRPLVKGTSTYFLGYCWPRTNIKVLLPTATPPRMNKNSSPPNNFSIFRPLVFQWNEDMLFGVCTWWKGRQHTPFLSQFFRRLCHLHFLKFCFVVCVRTLQQPLNQFSFSPGHFFSLLSQFFPQLCHLHFFQFCFGFSAWARQCQRSTSVQIIQMQSTAQHSKQNHFEAKARIDHFADPPWRIKRERFPQKYGNLIFLNVVSQPKSGGKEVRL